MQDFNFQGFRFTGSDFRPGYGCFQFLYKGYVISASNMGINEGACPTEIAVFKNNYMVYQCDTVEEAIEWVG